MTRRIRRVIAVAGIGGETAPLEELLGGLPEAGDDAVAVVGYLRARGRVPTLAQQAAV